MHRSEPATHDTGIHGARHADPWLHRCSIDATTPHVVMPQSHSRLVASLLAQLLQAPAPVFFFLSLSLSLSLSYAVLCGLKVFWNILECILLCKFVVVVCHVHCAAAYFTKVFVFYFLFFFFIKLLLLFTLFLTEYIMICVSVVLTDCVWGFILYLFEILNAVLLSIYLRL